MNQIEMLKAMLNAVLEQDDLFTLGARILQKSVNALVENGFTREEAIKIVANQGSIIGANK